MTMPTRYYQHFLYTYRSKPLVFERWNPETGEWEERNDLYIHAIEDPLDWDIITEEEAREHIKDAVDL